MALGPKDSEGGQFAYPKLQVMKFLEVIFVLQSPRFADCCQKNYWTKVPTTCLHDITLYCNISHHIDISLQYITVYYFTVRYILSHYMTLIDIILHCSTFSYVIPLYYIVFYHIKPHWPFLKRNIRSIGASEPFTLQHPLHWKGILLGKNAWTNCRNLKRVQRIMYDIY